jgi:hypothetical protein
MVTNRTAIDGELDHDGIKTAAARRRYIMRPGNVIAFAYEHRVMGTRSLLATRERDARPRADGEARTGRTFPAEPPFRRKGDVCPDIDDGGRIAQNEHPLPPEEVAHAHPP